MQIESEHCQNLLDLERLVNSYRESTSVDMTVEQYINIDETMLITREQSDNNIVRSVFTDSGIMLMPMTLTMMIMMLSLNSSK